MSRPVAGDARGNEERKSAAEKILGRWASRRQLLGAAAVGALAVPAIAKAQSGYGMETSGDPTGAPSLPPAHSPPLTGHGSDGTAEMFRNSLAAPTVRHDFGPDGISGAEIFANLCADEQLAALFLVPGNYALTHRMADVGIPSYGGRTEGGVCAAADGFSRATGETVAVGLAEGPGLTAAMMGIGAAHSANTPLLVLASNRTLSAEDNYRHLQFMYQQPMTEGMRKYGKRITAPERIYEYGADAFRQVKSGIPGIAHLDFPEEVVTARFKNAEELTAMVDKGHYRSESRPSPAVVSMTKLLDMISSVERPLIVAGHGVHMRRAWEPLLRVAEKNEIAVVGSGPVRGNFPDEHRLSGSMSNAALMKADLVIFVGQYLMPNPGEFTFRPNVTTVRVHPVEEALGDVWPLDLGIVSDEALFLETLADLLPSRKRETWVAELQGARAERDARYDQVYARCLEYSRSTGFLHPGVIMKETHDFLYKGKVDPKQTVTGYGGLTLGGYAGQWLRANRPAQELVTAYQFGAMGPEMPMMIGASIAVQRGVGPQAAYKGAPVLSFCGDGGIGFYIMELETAVKYRVPLIAVVYNNNCWGTIHLAQSQQSVRGEQLHLFQENLRYDKIAETMGARGEYCTTPEAYRAALARAYDEASRNNACTLINCQGMRDFSIASLYPPGAFFSPEPGVGALQH